MNNRYSTDAAFRMALEHRLLDSARLTKRPLDRLRKEVAHHRLIARLAQSVPPGSWALKGGMALLGRLDDRARATADADANWRSTVAELDDALDRVAALDLGDGFSFEIGTSRPLEGEGPDGALRYTIAVVLADRPFEQISFDVNILPGDERPTDEVPLRDLLAFADIPAPTVPVIPVAQQLAEKLHAYVRSYGNGSSRPRDLYDMLMIAERLLVPTAPELVAICRETFGMRQTPWPPAIPDPPSTWEKAWEGFVEVYRIPWTTLIDAGEHLHEFWDTLVASEVLRAEWIAHQWRWQEAPGG